jgi:hypothetical protein
MKKLFLTLSLSILFIPFGISQDLPSYVPTNGLVAYYPFNGNANDESGNGNHGTVNGATLTSDRDGNENSSYNFDGVDDYIFLGKNSDFPISNSFSISIFFLIQDVNCKNDTNDSCDNIIYNNEGLFELGINKINSKLKFSINNSEPDWGWIDIEFDYDFEKWIHLIFNYDDGLIKIFINNSNVYSYNGVGDIINDIHQDLDEFRLGNRQLGDVSNGNHFFTGKIDDFGIWNRALTEQEIQDVYTSSNGDIILNGVVSAENNQIKNVADPTEAQDAVTKSYTDTKFYTQSEVDALIANLQQQINEMNHNQVASSIELVEVFLLPNSRNIIKTSDSKYIIRTESDVFKSNAIDGNYESLNFNINVNRGDIHGHLLGETPNQSILISTKDNGLFRFENETWSASGLSGSGTSGNDFLRLNNDRILIAKQGFSRKTYYSDDNGVNWSTSSGTNNEDWRDFSVSSSGSIFIGSPGNNVGGVLRSQDNGLSFERIRTEKCRSTSTIGEVVYIISLNEENNNVLMKSTDDGATWTELFMFNNFKSGGYVEITFYAGNIIVLNDEKIFWSKFDEINFSETLLPSDYGSFREISHIDDKIYVVYDKGIFAVNGQY